MTPSRTILCWAGTILLWARLAAPAGAAPAGTGAVDTTAAPGAELAITEFGISTVLQNRLGGGDNLSADAALGYLARTGERTMIGGEVGFTMRKNEANLALRPRLRQEIGRDWALNLSAGPIVAGSVDSNPLDGLGLSVAVAVDHRGLVGFRLERQSVGYLVDWGPTRVKQRATTTTLGVRFGRAPGRMAIVGAAILGLIAAAGADYGLVRR